MNYKNTVSTAVLFSFAFIGCLAEIPPIQAQEIGASSANAAVFPPGSSPYGLTYGEWTGKWWQWAYSMPEEASPMVDDTGRNCANNQTGPVWFLAGTGGGAVTRQCTIPADKAILVPIINVECDTSSDPSRTEEDLRSCAKADQDTVTEKQITIDGVSIDNLDSYRVQSPVFNLTYPENNVAGLQPQTAKAVSDGYWVMLGPLSPGSHEIHFTAALGDPSAIGTTNFALDVRYLLTIVQGQTTTAPTEVINNTSITSQTSSGNSTYG